MEKKIRHNLFVAAAALIDQSGKNSGAKRPEGQPMGRLWGVSREAKVEAGETPKRLWFASWEEELVSVVKNRISSLLLPLSEAWRTSI